MVETVIIEFMAFYFGVSIALTALSILFKQVIKRHWFFYIPLIIAGFVFFPFGLVMLGYFLRIYDENRDERRFYAQEELEDSEDSAFIDNEVLF